MVRFIIHKQNKNKKGGLEVYIPIWLDLLYFRKVYALVPNVSLHSNMVRFIMHNNRNVFINFIRFTFQYGQIYYLRIKNYRRIGKSIYIPIWLDLLSLPDFYKKYFMSYLHSNMVRFIMVVDAVKEEGLIQFTFQYGQIYYPFRCQTSDTRENIYIPIWLDLLCWLECVPGDIFNYLHSNMVRFIIMIIKMQKANDLIFTFQYGQIYYFT